MSLVYCETCGLLLTPDATACPNCKAPPRPANGAQGAPLPPAAAVGPHARPAAGLSRWRIGAPVPWRSLGGWVRSVFNGNVVNVVVAFFCAWGTLPLGILTGGIGATLGGIAGAFSGSLLEQPVMSRLDWLMLYGLPIPWGEQPAIGHQVLLTINDLVPSLGWQTGGILGALIGAVCGGLLLGWHGLTFSWSAMWSHDPTTPVSNLIGAGIAAVLVAAAYVAIYAAAEKWITSATGSARTPTRAENAAAGALVAEVCVTRMGVYPSRPRVLVVDDERASAVPGLRYLTVSTGLLDEDPERAGVIVAYALALWSSGTPLARIFADGVALPLVVLYELARRILEGVRVRPIAFALRLLLWPLLMTGRWIAAPLRRWWWRRQVFRADARVAALGLGAELAAWLETTPARPRARGRGWWAMTAVDPPRAHRLDKLNYDGPTPAPPPAAGPGPDAPDPGGLQPPSAGTSEGVAV